MAQTVMIRTPDPALLDFSNEPEWGYTNGLVLDFIMDVWEKTGDEKYFDYIVSYYDKMINDDGSIVRDYEMDDYNIDKITPGKNLFEVYQQTGNEKYKKTLDILIKQLESHPRTAEGGLWHKKRYTHQMWLDGLYMGSPFMAEYAKKMKQPSWFDFTAKQLFLAEKNTRDHHTGLLYHGFDESRNQRWADNISGQSPNFWGRAVGWYAMALVDALDFFPEDHYFRDDIIGILRRLAEAISSVQDPETGVWYQILDKPDVDGNYLESSASVMFVYALAKGVRNGYLDKKYLDVAKQGYQGVLELFIEVDDNGLITLTRTCETAGLGGSGPYRDGTVDYYLSENIRPNDPKAIGPFIGASLEIEMLE
ncbi:MAG: glycoside hydrolase family 88 protein [Candidatus Marinimicrobia bacterium]|nr:glycoside hydrolase family 88 protein [Candidatus Neomarinimicrobiota bacterium]MCF7827404.1 glycoside hydrolase family 88 protein [Candidatus Neomarinimicrobiota bacterium]MCF7881363.1 glycoside hydrolase family 88 protein [Candidatus Neomarinimicrobiota bacterium]